MPELPEIEALRRSLDEPIGAAPVEKAGPAHIATLKTFDPPLGALEGLRFEGVRRRGKHLLFPTTDGELVLHVHLMSAGRLSYAVPGAKTPKTPAFRLTLENGGQLILTEGGAKKRARVGVYRPDELDAELAHLGPDALDLPPDRLHEILHDEARRLHPLLRDQRAIAGIGRAWSNEILRTAHLSPYALSTDLDSRGGRPAVSGNRRGAHTRACVARARACESEGLSGPQPPGPALSRMRYAHRPDRLRRAHDLLLSELPDGRPGLEGPQALTPVALAFAP